MKVQDQANVVDGMGMPFSDTLMLMADEAGRDELRWLKLEQKAPLIIALPHTDVPTGEMGRMPAWADGRPIVYIVNFQPPREVNLRPDE